MAARFTYSRWDGTQTGFELDADERVRRDHRRPAVPRRPHQRPAADDAARGFRTATANRLPGMRELMEQLRAERAERLERDDLGGVYDDIAEELRDVVDEERHAIENDTRSADASGDERRGDHRRSEAAMERNFRLDMLPADLAGKVRELQDYDFTSQEARERFEELMDQLRQQLMQQCVRPDVGRDAERVARGHAAHEGHDGGAQRDARSSASAARIPSSSSSWSSSATSSPRTRRRSTSCSSSWPSGWRPCRRCSTR